MRHASIWTSTPARPSRARWRGGDAAVSHANTAAIPSSPHWAGAAGESEASRHARGSGRPPCSAPPRGDRLHQRRQRGQQPRAPGRVLASSTVEPHRHVRGRASLDLPPCGFLERLGARVTICLWTARAHRSRRRPPRAHAARRCWSRDAREQRSGHDPADRRDRAARARTGVLCTPTPRSRSARCPCTSTNSASTCCLRGAQVLRAEGRRRAVRARAARASSPLFTALATRRDAVPAPRTCCSTSASVPPRTWPANGAGSRLRSASCATACGAGLQRGFRGEVRAATRATPPQRPAEHAAT